MGFLLWARTLGYQLVSGRKVPTSAGRRMVIQRDRVPDGFSTRDEDDEVTARRKRRGEGHVLGFDVRFCCVIAVMPMPMLMNANSTRIYALMPLMKER